MGKRLETTPRGKVRNAIRQVWLRSRERLKALQREHYTCQVCGKKQSVARGREQKVEVHHSAGRIGNWEKVIDVVYEEILCDPGDLEVLCPACHDARRPELAE